MPELATDCKNPGGRSLAIPTEVTDETAVQELARCAIERFGRIDVRVDTGAVVLFGRLEE